MKHLIAFMASNKIASRIVLRLSFHDHRTSFSIEQLEKKKKRKKRKEEKTKNLRISLSIYPT